MSAIRSLVILKMEQFELLLQIFGIFDCPDEMILYEVENKDAGFMGEKLGDGRVAVAFWCPKIDDLVHKAVRTAWEFQEYIELCRGWNTAQMRDFLSKFDAEHYSVADGSEDAFKLIGDISGIKNNSSLWVPFCYELMGGDLFAYKLEGDGWLASICVPDLESQTLAWFRMVDDR